MLVRVTPSCLMFVGSSVVMTRNLYNNNTKHAVVGAPRDGDNGTVIIFTLRVASDEITKNEEFIGPQFGASFGHSVAVVDIFGDK